MELHVRKHALIIGFRVRAVEMSVEFLRKYTKQQESVQMRYIRGRRIKQLLPRGTQRRILISLICPADLLRNAIRYEFFKYIPVISLELQIRQRLKELLLFRAHSGHQYRERRTVEPAHKRDIYISARSLYGIPFVGINRQRHMPHGIQSL